MALFQTARNQGRVEVPPQTATLLRKFGLDPDKQTFFFVFQGQNITLAEFCAKTEEAQTEILTKGSVFIA